MNKREAKRRMCAIAAQDLFAHWENSEIWLCQAHVDDPDAPDCRGDCGRMRDALFEIATELAVRGEAK